MDPFTAMAIVAGANAISKLAEPAIKTVCGIIEPFMQPIAKEAGEEVARRIKEASDRKRQLIEEAPYSLAARAELRHRNLIEGQQANLENVVRQAILLLQEITEDGVPPDEDWNEAFRAGAQEAYDDEMQRIWANLLAAEYRKPGTVNRRSMHLIKGLVREDAILFHRFLEVAFNNKYIMFGYGQQPLEYASLSLSDIAHMVSISLIATEQPLQLNFDSCSLGNDDVNGLALRYNGRSIFAYRDVEISQGIKILMLTDTGVALSKVLSVQCNISAVGEELKNQIAHGLRLRLLVRAEDGSTTVSKCDLTSEEIESLF
jgi:hypothetical protein